MIYRTLVQSLSVLAAAALTTIFASQSALAENGVTENSIKIGMANAHSGPTDHGKALEDGATAFFKRINDAGGVNGRKIEMIVADDNYNPQKTVELTKNFLETDKVFALFGYLGSANSSALLPTLAEMDVPYIAPLSGAQILRTPINKNIFNVRAGYEDEAEAMVAFAVDKLGIKDIGALYQDDGLGNSGKSGIHKALAKRNMKLKASAPYDRVAGNVDNAMTELSKAGVKAVLCFSTSKPFVSALKTAKKIGMKTTFISSSIVGEKDALAGAKEEAEGTYYIAAFPLVTDTSFEIVRNFMRDMKALNLAQDDFSLEGYADAAVLTEAIKRAGKNLTRDSLRKAFEKMSDVNVEGLKLKYSPTNHQGLDTVFLKQIKSGVAVPVH